MSYTIGDEWDFRKQICQIGKRLYDLFLVAGNEGNISIRLNDDEILITPGGVSKGMMQPEDIVKIAPDGTVLATRDGKKPSSEFRMHLIIYHNRPDVHAVVHAHPPTATGFAVAGVALDTPFLPEVVVRTGPTPLVPYAIPGGEELPEALAPYVQKYDTLLMGNHGVVAYGKTLFDAQGALETVELNARIYLTAYHLGNINFLSRDQVVALRDRYSR